MPEDHERIWASCAKRPGTVDVAASRRSDCWIADDRHERSRGGSLARVSDGAAAVDERKNAHPHRERRSRLTRPQRGPRSGWLCRGRRPRAGRRLRHCRPRARGGRLRSAAPGDHHYGCQPEGCDTAHTGRGQRRRRRWLRRSTAVSDPSIQAALPRPCAFEKVRAEPERPVVVTSERSSVQGYDRRPSGWGASVSLVGTEQRAGP